MVQLERNYSRKVWYGQLLNLTVHGNKMLKAPKKEFSFSTTKKNGTPGMPTFPFYFPGEVGNSFYRADEIKTDFADGQKQYFLRGHFCSLHCWFFCQWGSTFFTVIDAPERVS
jgi:hypothetical protein